MAETVSSEAQNTALASVFFVYSVRMLEPFTLRTDARIRTSSDGP